MKKQPSKQKSARSSKPFWCFRILVGFLAFSACHHQSASNVQIEQDKKSQPSNGIKNDILVAPKIIPITSANAPKVVKAGKPIIRIDSSNGGVPFFTNYGTEQGLALSSVSCSMADRAGNLWFGTVGGGVSRYDGKSFTNYSAVQGLAGNYVRCILQDNSGNIWIGNHRSGVNKYDGKTFTNYSTTQGLAGNSVRSIMQDNSGNIWFGTSGGVSKYDGKSFKNYTKAQGLAGNVVSSIQQDKSGSIWFGTDGGGASRYDGKSFTNYTTAEGLAGNSVRSIMQDNFGNIWFGTSGGISRYDGKTFTNYSTERGLATNLVSSILQDKSGNIWFGTSEGVSRYDGKSFKNYTTAQGLASNGVSSIIQDKSGNIWFGTDEGGVSRYDDLGLTNYTTAQGLAAKAVLSIIQDKSGSIWFGTIGGGVSRYDGKSFMNYTTVQGLAGNSVPSILQDNSGDIWFATDGGGASRYDGKSFTNYTTAQGLASNGINSIIQDKYGNIWFGTDRVGASRYDGKSFTNYTTVQGLASNGIECISQDKYGNIWFGTDEGVSRYDGKSFTNYTTAQGLVSNLINSIFQDKSGNLWFGTNRGVSRYDGKSFTNITTAQGLGDNVVYAIVEDPIRNIIWFGTNQGLSGLKTDPLPIGNQFEIFNKKTGYSIKDVNTNAILIDNNGILWGGCGDGKLIRFEYTPAKRSSSPLNLVIQNVKVNNEDICWNNLVSKPQADRQADSLAIIIEMATTFGKELTAAVLDSMREKYNKIRFDSVARFYPVPINLVLPYEDNNLSFDFAAIEPALPKQVRYQYKLEGYDKDWSPQSNGTTAVFGHIPEGSFTFKVKALSPYEAWSQTEYSFKVLPPWQRTWWAYAFYGICFLAGIYFTDRIRRRRVIEKERAQTREKELAQAKEIEKAYHELKTTQAQLIQSEKMASLGELTAGIAHEIQNPLNFVNNFSEINKELIEEMYSELQEGNINEAIAISNAIKENEEKISHHGKRADAIVKGMLQHSRISNGQKELANINAIADECLKLSYQGFRAKEKTFRANLLTDFDESIGKIPVVPQDIVRVFINLFNNAFYAVNEKNKQQNQNFEPAVSVSTKRTATLIEISVRDNGNGIPQKIFDKIFQPFFTTKPTGNGTGLGLSMSYDIIKAHGGEIMVDSKQAGFTEFVVQIPLV